jgi:hypothetical protein
MGGYLLSVNRFEAAIIDLISILCKRQSEESASLTGRIFIPSPINAWHDYRLTLRLGISIIYWNHSAFCVHSLGKPHGMME